LHDALPICTCQLSLIACDYIVISVFLQGLALRTGVRCIVIGSDFIYFLTMAIEDHQAATAEQLCIGPSPVVVNAISVRRKDPGQLYRSQGEGMHPYCDDITGVLIFCICYCQLEAIRALGKVGDHSLAVGANLDVSAFGTFELHPLVANDVTIVAFTVALERN